MSRAPTPRGCSVAELLAELQQVQARADAMEAILGHHGITVLESAEYDSANSSDEDSDSIPARDAEGGVGEGAEGTDGAADATLTLGPLDINPESYYTDGYLHIPKFLDEELSRGMRRLLLEPFGDGEWQGSARVCLIYDEQCAGIDASNPHGLRFLQQLLLVDPAWLKLATHPRLIEVATTLLGPDVNLHHAKASLKPPGHVSRQSWHQDAYYLYEVGWVSRVECPSNTFVPLGTLHMISPPLPHVANYTLCRCRTRRTFSLSSSTSMLPQKPRVPQSSSGARTKMASSSTHPPIPLAQARRGRTWELDAGKTGCRLGGPSPKTLPRSWVPRSSPRWPLETQWSSHPLSCTR